MRRLRIVPIELAAVLLFVSVFLLGQSSIDEYQDIRLRADSGNLTAGEVTDPRDTAGFTRATVYIDVNTLTLPDADDFVRFFVQVDYGGATWVDCQNFTFDTSDNGTTADLIAVIDAKNPGYQPGTGTLKSVTGTNPAAGSEISETVPANAVWHVYAIEFTLATDANVANRFPHVLFDDGSNVFAEAAQDNFALTASSSRPYYVGQHGENQSGAGGTGLVPIGKIELASGYRIRTVTNNFQVGDDYTAPQLLVEEWHNPAILTDATLRDDVRAYDRPLGTRIRIKTTVAGASAPTYRYLARAWVVR